MSFSDADATRFAHLVTAIEAAGGKVEKAELGEQTSGGVLGQMLGTLVGGGPAETTFAFIVSDGDIDPRAESEAVRGDVEDALENHPVGEGDAISADSPIPCGYCGGVMEPVVCDGLAGYICDDCEAALSPKGTDAEVQR